MIFALAGNQNCGKTTLFNVLTGMNQHVGNFPGVTVDQKSGEIQLLLGAEVVDLPGIYSLRPYTSEEIVARDFLLSGRTNAIINIVDATNLERNLYLTLQLMELRLPMVLALNMMDEVRASGGSIDVDLLSERLGIPVVPISAAKNEGIGELIRQAERVCTEKIAPKVYDFCMEGPVHRCIHLIVHALEDHAEKANLPGRFCAVKMIEGDEQIAKQLRLNENEADLIEHACAEMENETGFERNEALADMRYSFIEQALSGALVKGGVSPEQRRSEKLDKILVGKYTAVPVFILAMLLIFYLTFGSVGVWLSDALAGLIDSLSAVVDSALTNYGINPVVQSLVIDGIFAGVGGVVSFLPTIVTLFFFLSILEDTGYMARVAMFMDRPMRKIGLSGRSFVPMLMGFGCTVPALMATRTLASERDRKMTMLLTPFMSCSAKVPIYATFCAAFFARKTPLVMVVLYAGGMLLGVLCAAILGKTAFRGGSVPFLMELPNYRLPSPKSVFLLLWEKARDFLERAFTIIFVATIVIWFLQTFDLRLNVVEDSANSLLAAVGKAIAPIFRPVGFGDWRAVTALFTGFTAKEAVVSTLAVLLGTSTAELPVALSGMFTPLAASSYLAFTLLYTPCVAAIATVKKEWNSTLATIGVVVFQCAVAYLIALLIFQAGSLFV